VFSLLLVSLGFGVKDTLHALEMGSVEELIVWESLDMNRLVLKHKESGVERIVYLSERQEKDQRNFKDATDGVDLETVDKQTLLEWLAENFKKFGAKLQFVTDKSQEGSQFCKGFGGIGGILRYQVDFLTMEVEEMDADDDDFVRHRIYNGGGTGPNGRRVTLISVFHYVVCSPDLN
jgi:peptide chain release factor subunit 1